MTMYQKLVETGLECKETTLWNEEVRAVRKVPKNKPGIVIRGKEMCTLTFKNLASHI